jgi:glycosyltransferase involved in cell wall biosynthesis
VSHYNYYRNFETLLRALPLIRARLSPAKVVLFLTCKLDGSKNPDAYDGSAAGKLAEALGVREQLCEVGAVPYRALHHLYRACDIYVSAAYAETFAHPLVEAMASRVPVVASDLPVHREICRGAARYFSCFSETELADRVIDIVSSERLATELAKNGLERSGDFSWARHVTELLDLASNWRKLQEAGELKYIPSGRLQQASLTPAAYLESNTPI